MLHHSLFHLQNPNLQLTLSNPFHSLSCPSPPVSTPPSALISCSAFRNKPYTNFRISDIRWKDIYKKVALLENPETGVSAIINQCEIEGKIFYKSELSMFIKNLRKFRRFKLALEVCEWMNGRAERFKLSSSDMAIMLDLIAKVHGIRSGEDFFTKLPDFQKDKRVYGALLNAYVDAKEKDRAELLMQKMISKGCISYPLSFNVMMTLYMKLKDYSKVETLITEMKKGHIRLDLYSYSIWLSARGSQGSVAGFEEVVKEMKEDQRVVPNSSTCNSVAAWYIRMGEIEKAKDWMKNIEKNIDGVDRQPYHFLLSLYARVGDKEGVYRLWRSYKSEFLMITNWGYYTVIRALVEVSDIAGAEKIYNEWLLVKSSYDSRIGNILLSWYVKEGYFEKVHEFFAHMEEAGAKPFASTWEILAECHTKQRRIADALDSFRRAKSSGYWKPTPSIVSAFLELCEKEGDEVSKEEMGRLLSDLGSSGYEKLNPTLVKEKTNQLNEGYSSHPSDEIGWSGDEDSEILLPVS